MKCSGGTLFKTDNLQSLGHVLADIKDAAMLGIKTASFLAIVTLWIICINSLTSSADSLSAFGELSVEHKKAVGLELLIAVKKVSSVIACNLWCLNDKDCKATNFFSAANDDNVGDCELLKGFEENALDLVEQQNATFTRLRKVGGADQKGGQCSLSTCPCDEGYFHHEESGSCFMISKYSATWAMSFQICKNRDAILAKIDSKSKLDFIRSKTRLYFIYIGLKQEKNGSLWWADGTEAIFDQLDVGITRNILCNDTDICCGVLEDPRQHKTITLTLYNRLCVIASYSVCEKNARKVNKNK